MSSLLNIEMFWYASFQLGLFLLISVTCTCTSYIRANLIARLLHPYYSTDRDLLIDHRRGSHTRKPDRTIRLSKENAKLLPEKIFHQEAHETCSICINEFVPGEVLKVLQPCQHTFHSSCITHWLTECKNCCPLCMKPVVVTK
jgi:hypothetical protein